MITKRFSVLACLLLGMSLPFCGAFAISSFSWSGAAMFSVEKQQNTRFYGHLTLGMAPVDVSVPVDAVSVQQMLTDGGFDAQTHAMYPVQFDLARLDAARTGATVRKVNFANATSDFWANGDQMGKYRNINFSAKLTAQTPLLIVNEHTAVFVAQLSDFSAGLYGDSLILREMKNNGKATVYVTINTAPDAVVAVLRNGMGNIKNFSYTATAYVN